MRRDIDPIKIIQILPLSGGQGKPPDEPPLWLVFLKKTVRDLVQMTAQRLRSVRDKLINLRTPLNRLSHDVVGREETREEESLTRDAAGPPVRPNMRLSSLTSEEGGAIDLSRFSESASARIHMLRRKVAAGWQTHFTSLRQAWSPRLSDWREMLRHRLGKQQWRKRTERMIRPFATASRRLRQQKRDDLMRMQLESAQAISQQQHSLSEQSAQLSSMKKDLAAQRKTIEELTRQLRTLQVKVAQTLPTTHGTTGQSGPAPHGKRGVTQKRNDPSETSPQSRTEH
jgi:hypothetical protein